MSARDFTSLVVAGLITLFVSHVAAQDDPGPAETNEDGEQPVETAAEETEATDEEVESTEVEEAPLACEEATSFKKCKKACRQKFPKKKKKKAEENPDPLPSVHGWWTLGVGGALLVTGGIMGGYALSLNGKLEDSCPKGDCPPSKHGDLDTRDRISTTSTILLGAGLAATTVGILILTVFSGDEEPSIDDQEISLTPLAGPGLAGAVFDWRF